MKTAENTKKEDMTTFETRLKVLFHLLYQKKFDVTNNYLVIMEFVFFAFHIHVIFTNWRLQTLRHHHGVCSFHTYTKAHS